MAKSQVSSPVKPCMNPKKDTAKIISVEFLDGNNDSIIKGTGDQFVNLTSENKYVDGSIIKNIDRLSRNPRIKVEFDKPGYHSFWIKLLPEGSNTVYSEDEKKRNNRFRYSDKEQLCTLRFDSGKAYPSVLSVAVAGNDSYSVEARDIHGNKVSSTGKIKTSRLIHIVEIKMKELAFITKTLNVFEYEFFDNYIKIAQLPSVEIDYIENIDRSKAKQVDEFKKAVRKAFKLSDGQDKRPHCVAIAYTDHIAKKLPSLKRRKINQTVGPGSLPISINILKGGESKSLWINIATGEDWFVSCTFLGKNKGSKPVKIEKAKCIPKTVGDPNYFEKVEIDASGLPVPAGTTGTITLIINCVDSMAGGISFGNSNIICISTRGWWEKRSDLNQNLIAIHEMGHRIGMVSNGKGMLPSKVTTYYRKKVLAPTHIGPHCHEGISAADTPYDSAENRLLASCVMYGAMNDKTAFCANCKPAVRKLDISEGWT